jgi:hypothetical protein
MTQELIIIGFVMRSEPSKNESKVELEKKIQNMILDLSDKQTSILMQNLHKWDPDKSVMEYSAENIGHLVTYGNNEGWDVELNIEVGHDYHIVGEHIIENGTHKYRIYGIHNEFDEWASLLDLHTLVGEIANDESKQRFLWSIRNRN